MRITGKEGDCYIISCEKCGTEIRKNKSFCTRYGDAYHFNPTLKCNQCGFSVKIVYEEGSNLSFASKTSPFNKNDDIIPCPNWNLSPNEGGANEKQIDFEEKIEDCPEFIKKRIDVKIETINAVNVGLKKLKQEKIIPENVKTLIITNFGVVAGTVQQEVETRDGVRRISLDPAKMRNHHLYKLGKEVVNPIITNNHSFVTIVDAKVIPFSNPSNILTVAALNLFSDQIVGFACGEYQ
jgi:hypothetical protein